MLTKYQNNKKYKFCLKLFLVLSCSLFFLTSINCNNQKRKQEKLQLCITFDDTFPHSNYLFDSETGNQMILDKLAKHNIQAMFFLNTKVLLTSQGTQMVKKWNDAGHIIGNHSFSHFNYHKNEITSKIYINDFLIADSLLQQFSGFQKYFRFPMLREGNTKEKRDSFRKILKEMNYKIGYVTIDNSEWFINHRLRNKLKNNETIDLEKYKQVYIKHLYNLIQKFDRIAKLTTKVQIPHVLLLHNNITSALFLEDIIKMCKTNNWEIINPLNVYKNKFYNSYPNVIWQKGESLILSKAKAAGKLTKSMAKTTETEHDRLVIEINELEL